MEKIPLFVMLVLLSNASMGQPNDVYLKRILNNIEKIQSATYFATIESWAPGDTSASLTYHYFYKEYDNPADTTIGAAFVKLLQDDTTKAVSCYDGTMIANVSWDEKYIQIDSFQNNRHPFRPLNPPFFNYIKSIIKYVLETDDSISIDVKDVGDSVYVKLASYGNKQVEFFGKPYYLQGPYPGAEISGYEIWIDESTGLPYHVRRAMSHNISVMICKNITVNTNNINSLLASDYLPAGFSLKTRGEPIKNDLTGRVAPGWILNGDDGETVALDQMKSKVLMVHFTSVSCGPCQLSVSFLKQLASEYNKNDFDFVSIESFNRNSLVLEKYRQKNGFNYKFLISTDDVTSRYEIKLVPVFYILDQDRVIRQVILGYQKGTTDNEIRTAIEQLL